MLPNDCIAKTARLKKRFSFDHEWTTVFCELVPKTLVHSKLNTSNS
jgi:hypothetical protein